ncbi:hypothetical protein ZHAS_00017456 [Anopheles sinensis]|uniref:Uncharacterized protein n=1 Tax=Anopheles sinensis TaxID=74873 RepID=A0A084WGV7_ANOSI|nr:hypothetical protein ZHAS_00017456 [Anopheles sinensis]
MHLQIDVQCQTRMDSFRVAISSEESTRTPPPSSRTDVHKQNNIQPSNYSAAAGLVTQHNGSTRYICMAVVVGKHRHQLTSFCSRKR